MAKTARIADEGQVISQCGVLFDGLAPDARLRVLGWLSAKYAPGHPHPGNEVLSGPPKKSADGASPPPGGLSAGYETFAELHDAAKPKSEPDNALVAGYWLQFACGSPAAHFKSADANAVLKEMGVTTRNIALAFNRLKEKKPALVLQVGRDGAFAKLKLTIVGKRRVEGWLNGRNGAEDEDSNDA